jgi:hypothetical protein
MRTRLTERDLSRIVRRVINEQDLEKDEVILNPIKPILQNTIEKIKDIQNCGCGDFEQWKRMKELLEQQMEILSLPEKMKTLPPKEIEY